MSLAAALRALLWAMSVPFVPLRNSRTHSSSAPANVPLSPVQP